MRRPGRIFLKTALAFLGLAAASLTGLYLWLGTEAGAKAVFGRLQGLVAEGGLTLSARSFEGPLPRRLRAEGLLVEGVFSFQAEALEVELSPSALLTGRLHLTRVRLTGPVLVLPPSDDQDGQTYEFPLPRRLPRLRLDDLVLTGGRLEAGAFNQAAGLGELDLTAALAWRPESGLITDNLKLTGTRWRWPEGPTAKVLGEDWLARGSFSASPAGRLVLSLERFESGTLGLSGQAAWTPGPAGGELGLDLLARLENVAPLFPGLSGPVEAGLRGGGRPLELLTVGIKARSPGLSSPQGDWTGLDLEGEVNRAAPGGDSELSGRLALQAGDSPGGPLSLKGHWRFRSPGVIFGEDLEIKTTPLALAGGLKIDLTGEYPGLSGRLTGEAFPAPWNGRELRGGPARLTLDLDSAAGQKADLEVELARLTLGPPSSPDLALAEAKARLKAEDLFGRRKVNLNLNLGPGQAGGLAWSQGQVQAEARGDRGTWRLDLSAAGAGRDHLTAGGSFSPSTAEVTRLDLKAGPAGLKLAAPLRLSWGEDFKVSPVKARLHDHTIPAGQGEVEKFKVSPVKARLHDHTIPAGQGVEEKFKISPLKARLLPAGELNLTAKPGPGQLSLKAEIKNMPYRVLGLFTRETLPEGQVQSLKINVARRARAYSGDFTLKTSLGPGGPLGRLTPEMNLAGRLEGRALIAQGSLAGGPGWPAAGQIALRLPLAPGPGEAPPRPDLEGEVRGRLDFSGPLEPLWLLADLPDRTLAGQARVGLEMSGSLSRPALAGSLQVAEGRYEDKVLGLWLRDLNLKAESLPDQPLRVALTGRDLDQGALSLAGEIHDLSRPVLRAQGRLESFEPFRPVLRAQGRLESFKPFRRDDLSLTLSGGLGLAGSLDRLILTSDLTLEEGGLNLNLVTGAGSIATLPLDEASEPAAGPPAAEGPLQLDLKLDAPGRFQIAGQGLESEWRGRLRVKGPPGPGLDLTGELRPLRGWYEPPVFGQKFNFEGGQIIFTGGPIPFLDLELTNHSPELTAVIKISGPASQPRVTLTSRPPMSQDEVAGRLLFGKSPSSISRLEALQLAAVLKDLTSFGGDLLNPMTTVRRSLGLDVLRLGGGFAGRGERQVSDMSGSLAGDLNSREVERTGNEAVAVEAGKYINDNIYMGMEHDRGGPAVRLEVELAPSLALEARGSQESGQVGLGWKKDY